MLHALHAELIRQDGAVDRKKTNFPSVKNWKTRIKMVVKVSFRAIY